MDQHRRGPSLHFEVDQYPASPRVSAADVLDDQCQLHTKAGAWSTPTPTALRSGSYCAPSAGTASARITGGGFHFPVSTSAWGAYMQLKKLLTQPALGYRETLTNRFPQKSTSSSKQVDFGNRIKRVESRGSERNRPFGEEADGTAGWQSEAQLRKSLRILGLIAEEIPQRKGRGGRAGGAREIRT